jgi:hypothetical protein
MEQSKPMMNFFRVEEDQLPAVVLIDSRKMRFAKLLKVEKFDAVDDFLGPFEAGLGPEHLDLEPFNRTRTDKRKAAPAPWWRGIPVPRNLWEGFAFVVVPALVVGMVVGLALSCCCRAVLRPKKHLKAE